MTVSRCAALGLTLLVAGGISPSVRAADDLAACGRKAVEAGVGAGSVSGYVARCVEEMKAARASGRDERGRRVEEERRGRHRERMQDASGDGEEEVETRVRRKDGETETRMKRKARRADDEPGSETRSKEKSKWKSKEKRKAKSKAKSKG